MAIPRAATGELYADVAKNKNKKPLHPSLADAVKHHSTDWVRYLLKSLNSTMKVPLDDMI